MADTIKLKDIVKDPRLQLRVKGLDKHHVAELVEALKAGKKLGSIKGCRKGKKVFVYDGWHRIAAHEEHGLDEIDATLTDGDLEQAALMAAGANSAHGLKRTNDDKRAAVKAVLSHSTGKDWSDRRIADHVDVGDKLVAELRSQLREPAVGKPTDSENTGIETRVGRDGKRRKVAKKTSKPSKSSTKKPTNAPAGDTETPPAGATSSTNGTVHAKDADPLDQARSTFRSLTARLDAKHNELNALAEEMKAFTGAGFEKLNGTHSITSRIGDAARSCKSAAANLRNAAPHDSPQCTTCKGKGHGCKDCAGMGWQSNEERRDADNRKAANAPKVASA